MYFLLRILGSTLLLASLAHLLVISTSYIIIEESNDLDAREDSDANSDTNSDSMVPYVYRPRYSSSVSPDKRTIDKEFLAEDYRELRDESNEALNDDEEDGNEQKRTHYVIVRESAAAGTGEASKKQMEFGFMRGKHRFSGNGKRNFYNRQPQQRPRFHMDGKKEASRPRFSADSYGRVNNKRALKLVVLKKHHM